MMNKLIAGLSHLAKNASSIFTAKSNQIELAYNWKGNKEKWTK